MKSFFLSAKSLILLTSLSIGSIATAGSLSTVTERLTGGEFSISPGQTQTVKLRGWRYVQKIFVSASGYNSDSTFEVIANGDVKGTIHVPGRDPSYVVTIGETVQSIQFRNVSAYSARVYDVQAVMSENTVPSTPISYPNNCEFNPDCHGPIITSPVNPYLPARNTGAYLSSRAITLVDQLENFANYQEYGIYLLPIKKVAARAYATTTNYGDLSMVSRNSLLVLKQQIDFASMYLDQTFERDAAFQVAVELSSLGKSLEALLR